MGEESAKAEVREEGHLRAREDTPVLLFPVAEASPTADLTERDHLRERDVILLG